MSDSKHARVERGEKPVRENIEAEKSGTSEKKTKSQQVPTTASPRAIRRVLQG